MTSVFHHAPKPYPGPAGPADRSQHEAAREAEPGTGPASGTAPAADAAATGPWQAARAPSAKIETPATLQTALGKTFGDAIAKAVLTELGLDKPSDRELTAREVNAAVAACATSASAVSGLNFVSQSLLSARSNSPQFQDCARTLGIDTQSLSDETRSAIDLAFAREMALAGSAGRRSVDLRDAASLMRRAITTVMQGAGQG